MTTHDIRAKNLRTLIDSQFDGVASRLAEKIGRQPAYVYRLFTDNQDHRRSIGEDLARDIELKLGIPRGSLDQEEMSTADSSAVISGYEHGGEDKRAAMKDISELPEEAAAALRPIIEALKAKYGTQ